MQVLSCRFLLFRNKVYEIFKLGLWRIEEDKTYVIDLLYCENSQTTKWC